jgi:LysM repeat protein
LPVGTTPPVVLPGMPPVVTPPAGTLPKGAFYNEQGELRYTVQKGDYGAKIAKAFGKSPPEPWVPSMVAANPQVKDWKKVYPGQVIALPNEWADPNAPPPLPGNAPRSRRPPLPSPPTTIPTTTAAQKAAPAQRAAAPANVRLAPKPSAVPSARATAQPAAKGVTRAPAPGGASKLVAKKPTRPTPSAPSRRPA